MKLSSREARDLASRLAGAAHSRRLYTSAGPAWERTLAALHHEMMRVLGDHEELTVGLLGESLAVAGVPVDHPPSAVERFVGVLKKRDVEIISFRRGFTAAELETLLSYMSADSADVAAVRADLWLRERGVEHIAIKHLKLMRGEGSDSFRDVYRRGGRDLRVEFERARRQGVVSFGAVAELAKALMEIVVQTEAPIATLLALRDRDDFSLVHSINVSVLVTAQASALGLNDQRVQEISSAALLHDIGKTKVPDAILTRRALLNSQEKALLARHTHEGARILLDTHGMDRLAPLVAAKHHDGPSDLLPVELTRIADAFDVVRTLRPFDDRAGLKGAVTYLIRNLGHRFNPYLLERFAAMCRLFEAGEHTRLTTGEIVRIVEPHPELALHPVVEVLDRGRGRSDRGALADLAKNPDERSILPPVPTTLADLAVEEIDALG